MRDDKTTKDFKTGRPLPAQNPTGVIEFGTGRLFSRLDVELLNRIDRLALRHEAPKFFKKHPGQFSGPAAEAWLMAAGGVGAAGFDDLIGAPESMRAPPAFLRRAERHLATTFYDRLQRWLSKEDHAAIDAAPLDHGVPVTKATRGAGRLARRFARRALPIAWREMEAFREESARAWAELLEQDHLAARAFAATHVAPLTPTDADLDELARRLVARHGDSETQADFEAAATTNPLLREALAAYAAWQERLEKINQESGNGPEMQLEAKRQRSVTFARTYALNWTAIRHAWELEHATRLGVARALSGPLSKEDRATTGEAVLREAVASELARTEFLEAVGWPWVAEHAEEEADGMATPRARLLAYLRRRFCPKGTGPALEWLADLERHGQTALAEWKKQDRLDGVEAVSPWQALTPSLAVSLVAQVVWVDRVRADLERTTASAPALVAQVHADVGLLFRPSDIQRELELRAPGLAWVAVGNEEDAARLFGAGATLTFQRLIRHLPTVAHETWARTQRDEADVVIEGGYAGLAEAIGAKSKKAAAEVRDALMLGNSIRREWADGSEAQGLWTFHMTPAAPGRPARLIITLAAAFRPGFVHQLPKGEGRTLVPVVPLPALIGATNFHAAQAALQWEVTRRLSEGRKEAAREGGVSIGPADWKRMLERVGLPAHLLPKVLDAWKAGEQPFLENVRGDLWTIADSAPFAPARAWLHEQANLSRHGRKRGLAGKAKRRGGRKASKP